MNEKQMICIMASNLIPHMGIRDAIKQAHQISIDFDRDIKQPVPDETWKLKNP